MRLFPLLFLLVLYSNRLHCQGYVKLKEPFDNNDNEWPTYRSTEQYAAVENGRYVIEQKVEGVSGFWREIPVNPRYNYAIKATFRQLSGIENAGHGLLFGWYDWNDYYAFTVSSNGYARIYGQRDGRPIQLKRWTPFDAVRPQGETNVLEIKQKDEVVRFYINRKLFFTCSKIAIVGNGTGCKLDGKMRVMVDDLNIACYRKKIRLAEHTTAAYQKENLGAAINSALEEKAPFITADGRYLYYNIKDHPQNIAKGYTDIWYSERDEEGNWLPAKHLPSLFNNNGNNFIISITPDGNKALLGNTYRADGTAGVGGVSMSLKKDGRWQLPQTQKIHHFRNEDRYVSYFMTADGTKLLLSIDDGNSYGNKDLYVSFLREDGVWSTPMNLGPMVNSYMTDFSPFLAPDGKTLYFSSYGHPGYGHSDIFMCKRKDESWTNWTAPQNLGPFVNTPSWDAYFTLSARGDDAYLVSSHSGYGKGDIFRVRLDTSVQPEAVLIVRGKVVNKKTNQPIDSARVEYENLTTLQREGVAQASGWDGYQLALPAGVNYGFRAEAKGFLPVSEHIDLSRLEAFSDTTINLFLVPVEKGQTLQLNNIFFDEGKSILRSESELELRRMIDALITHNNFTFEVGGHSDIHSADGAENLSENRARTVYQFLVQHGIPAERLSYKGYGATQPISKEDTPIGRQRNRRVEITIQ